MRMRVLYTKLGAHVHCSVYTAPDGAGATFSKNGELVFDEREWSEIARLFRTAEFVDQGTRNAHHT